MVSLRHIRSENCQGGTENLITQAAIPALPLIYSKTE